jgi:hypothetical protein
MSFLRFTLLLAFSALTATQLSAQGFEESSKIGNKVGGADDKSTAKLKGITFFFIDVSTSESRPEDGELRIELEMRRANIVPKEFSGNNPENSTPLLSIEVRFDRGLGRYSAEVVISVRDNATVIRNKEPVLAQTYTQTKKAVGSSDNTLAREVKARARELVVELIEGMKKNKGL